MSTARFATASLLVLAATLLPGIARAEQVRDARTDAEQVSVGPPDRGGAKPPEAALRPLAVLVSFGVAITPTVELALRAHRHLEIAAGLASESMDRPFVTMRGLYPIATGRSWTLALHAGLGGGVDASGGDDDLEAPMVERAYLRADAGVTVERRGFTVRVSGGIDGVDQAPFAALGVGVAF